MKLTYIIIVLFISYAGTNPMSVRHSEACPGKCKYRYGEPGKVTACDCFSTDKMYVKIQISQLLKCIPNTVSQLELSKYNFGTISNGSFQHLPKLEILNMTECNITVLERNGFNGIKDLYELVISDLHKDNPGLCCLNHAKLSHTPRLKTLTLGKIIKLENDAFEAIPNLKTLVAHHESLVKYHVAFQHLKKVENLYLENIGLTKIPAFILSHLPSLRQLYLVNNKISKLKFEGVLPQLNYLTVHLAGNMIKEITKDDILPYKNASLLSLYLEDNDIKYIDQNIFQDVNIRNIKLDGNTNFRNYNFQTLLKSLQNKTVRSLLLNGCGIVIERFTASILQPLQNSSLLELQIGDNTIETFEGDAFEYVDSLIALRISNFMYISHFTLKPLKKLNQLIIADMPVVRYKQPSIIDLNVLKDLIVLEISKINAYKIFFHFSNLTNLKSLSLPNMGFFFISKYYSQVLDLLGNSGRPFTFTDINLSGNLMFQLSSEKLCSLFWGIKVTKLYLQDNYFTALPTCIFQNSEINTLFLNRNRITHVQGDLFKNRGDIVAIDLSQNAIQSIDGNAFAYTFNAPVIKVKIDNNLLACNCEIGPFRNWLKFNNYRNIEYDEFCKSPNRRIKEKLLHFEITWLECNMDFFIKLCTISGSCFLITITLIVTLLKYFWGDIKYKRMVWKAKRHNGIIPVNDEEIYDAFVSYHSEKRIWVNQVMTRELCGENLDFSLIHDDNIIPGQESYFSGIMTHMDRSHHIIFLVTRGWMTEGWNEFEMNAAIDMLSQSKRHTLIVILMENIPQREMSGELRLMVRNNVCLKWSEEEGKQRKFWRDLKLELGKKKFHMT